MDGALRVVTYPRQKETMAMASTTAQTRRGAGNAVNSLTASP